MIVFKRYQLMNINMMSLLTQKVMAADWWGQEKLVKLKVKLHSLWLSTPLGRSYLGTLSSLTNLCS